MRIRRRRRRTRSLQQSAKFCLECQSCVRRYYCKDEASITHCPYCGGMTATYIFGRYEAPAAEIAAGAERVAAYRLSVAARSPGAPAYRMPGRIRARVARRGRMAKILKIRGKKAGAAEAPEKGKTKLKVESKPSRGPASQPGRFLGRTTGMSVAKFQNKTLEDNRKKHLTDAALAKVWRDEFPNARATYTEDTVRGVRSVYNRGKHGNDAPAVPVPEYGADGKAIPAHRAKDADRVAPQRGPAGKAQSTDKKGGKRVK